jgi:hypothetical protein
MTDILSVWQSGTVMTCHDMRWRVSEMICAVTGEFAHIKPELCVLAVFQKLVNSWVTDFLDTTHSARVCRVG